MVRCYLFFGMCILFLINTSCSQEKNLDSEIVWLTVFIHGTIGLRSQLNFATIVHLMRDNIANTKYKKIIGAIRQDPFFYQVQAMQKPGLIPIDMDPSIDRGAAATCFAKLFQENVFSTIVPTTNLYYTYGWSGLLSHSDRYREAEKLYHELSDQIVIINKQYPQANVHLRLVCYSHGGSVALNLAAVQQNIAPEHLIYIDELILLGTPVQKETDTLIYNPIFKKIYHFYSRKDVIQKMDCFSLQRFFSNRRFKFKYKKLPAKLQQIEIRIKSKKHPHTKRYRIDRSPTHAELWFFGWTLASYRGDFPVYPLPIGVLTPACIQLINKHMHDQKHIVIELQSNGIALLRRRHHSRACVAPWISAEKLEELRNMAEKYDPKIPHKSAYKEHINRAMQLY